VAQALVGRVARGDLGLDEGAQQFLWRPALGLGLLQGFGGHRPNTGQLQALEPGEQVGSQRRGGLGGHRSTSGA
jgi:hypothetical protein